MVDSGLFKFEAIRARKIRRLPFRFSFGDVLEFVSWNPRYEVELIFKLPPKKISLEEVKKLFSNSFRRNDHWESMMDFEEFRHKGASAPSIEELMEVGKEFHRF